MIAAETLRSVVDRLANAASSPARVILFGSYARGTATEDSDLDLMVIEKELPDKPAEYLRLRLRRAVGGIGIGVDVLVYSEEEALLRGQVPGTVLYWALKEGRGLHDEHELAFCSRGSLGRQTSFEPPELTSYASKTR